LRFHSLQSFWRNLSSKLWLQNLQITLRNSWILATIWLKLTWAQFKRRNIKLQVTSLSISLGVSSWIMCLRTVSLLTQFSLTKSRTCKISKTLLRLTILQNSSKSLKESNRKFSLSNSNNSNRFKHRLMANLLTDFQKKRKLRRINCKMRTPLLRMQFRRY
jgi:hypothetical protein